MATFSKGIYKPKNPEKYVGKHSPVWRSSWEMAMMMFLDNNKHIIHWASEPIYIQYRHPFTGKMAKYIPDFFVVYENKHKKRVAEILEIKPRNQTISEGKRVSKKDQIAMAINRAKWKAASLYCKQQGLVFRVINEQDMFKGVKK